MSESGTSPKSAVQRLRFRFGLRALFVVVTVLAIFFGYYANWISQRREARAWLDMQVIGGSIGFHPSPASDFPWMLRLLGEEPKNYILMQYQPAHFNRPVPEEYRRLVRRVERLFPEASVMDLTPSSPATPPEVAPFDAGLTPPADS